jgi:hypothetical protein
MSDNYKNRLNLKDEFSMRKLLILLVTFVTACSPIQSGPARTAIPTLIPATMPASSVLPVSISYGNGDCKIAALDLIGAWVKAGKPQSNNFAFTSIDNTNCDASYVKDIQPLFSQPNIWYAGAIACVTCHGEDVTKSPAGLSLTDFENIMSGSRRKDQSTKGNDILGDATTWEKSKLYIQIFTRQMPVGRPPSSPEKGPAIYSGSLIP